MSFKFVQFQPGMSVPEFIATFGTEDQCTAALKAARWPASSEEQGHLMRLSNITPEFVEFVPKMLVPGVLYISQKYKTASHPCACGCGEKVVTPLSPADWQLHVEGNAVSLHPSIGNWDYACQSHY